MVCVCECIIKYRKEAILLKDIYKNFVTLKIVTFLSVFKYSVH